MRIVGGHLLGDPFEQRLRRRFPKLCFDFVKLPHQRFRVLLQVHSLVLLISARYLKRGVIARALIFRKNKSSVSSAKQAVGAGDHIELIVSCLLACMMDNQHTNVVVVGEAL